MDQLRYCEKIQADKTIGAGGSRVRPEIPSALAGVLGSSAQNEIFWGFKGSYIDYKWRKNGLSTCLKWFNIFGCFKYGNKGGRYQCEEWRTVCNFCEKILRLTTLATFVWPISQILINTNITALF